VAVRPHNQRFAHLQLRHLDVLPVHLRRAKASNGSKEGEQHQVRTSCSTSIGRNCAARVYPVGSQLTDPDGPVGRRDADQLSVDEHGTARGGIVGESSNPAHRPGLAVSLVARCCQALGISVRLGNISV